MRILSLILAPALLLSAAASAQEYMPEKYKEFAMIGATIDECLPRKDALRVSIQFGTAVEEFLGSLARSSGLPETGYNEKWGPFKTQKDYKVAVQRLRLAYTDFLEDRQFQVREILTPTQISALNSDAGLNRQVSDRVESELAKVTRVFANRQGWSKFSLIVVLYHDQAPDCGQTPDLPRWPASAKNRDRK